MTTPKRRIYRSFLPFYVHVPLTSLLRDPVHENVSLHIMFRSSHSY